MTDAVVLAGGRIGGWFARATGTRVKALVPVAGTASVARVVHALAGAEGIGRICVVGPQEAGEAAGEPVLWQAERDTALANALAGLERLGGDEHAPVLLCGADAPLLTPPAVDDFLRRAPDAADIALPVIRRERFVATFPGNLGIYVRLAEGAFTGGSQFLVRPRALRENLAMVESLHRRRKSQLAMASALGAGLVWKLVSGKLTTPQVEARLSLLTGCRCRAVPDCHPELAFDMDMLPDLRYAERWLRVSR